jgi:hypothetical protein
MRWLNTNRPAEDFCTAGPNAGFCAIAVLSVHLLDSVELLRIDAAAAWPDPQADGGAPTFRSGPAVEWSMTTREFFHSDGKTWLVRLRPEVRKDEASTHVTLELVCDEGTRVVSCLRSEWETQFPDYVALLARSVAAGASHGITRPPEPSSLGGD